MATKIQWQLRSNGNLVPMATKVQVENKFQWQLRSKKQKANLQLWSYFDQNGHID